MVRNFGQRLVLLAVCGVLAVCLAATAHSQSVTFIGSTTSSDYSDTGLDIGNKGFWFANFDAPAQNSGSGIGTNAVSSLPSWVTVNTAPDTTFASSVTTSGGQGWDVLTLPDGTTGQSGAAIDSNTANNSNNSIRRLELGLNAPRRFYFHIVTDNTNGANDPASRLRARLEKTGTFDISAVNTPPGLAANMNGDPDVYTWLYDSGPTGSANAFIKVQLNSGNALEAASIAGFMFDRIPEPSSAILLILGTIGCGCVRRRHG
jgi:hypothetical protein